MPRRCGRWVRSRSQYVTSSFARRACKLWPRQPRSVSEVVSGHSLDDHGASGLQDGSRRQPSSMVAADAAYPTEERIKQVALRKERKAKGIAVKKRVKPVEQHFDDCGTDLSSLQGLEDLSFGVFDSDYTSSDDELLPQHSTKFGHLNNWMLFGLSGSDVPYSPQLPYGCFLAADPVEMVSMLAACPRHWGVDVVELCGGSGRTSYLSIVRGLTSGHNFELLTGCDLNDTAHQEAVWHYFDVACPLVVVMGPTCAPFGRLGQQNKYLWPEAWQRAYDTAAPHGRFCGHVALRQSKNTRWLLFGTLPENPR